MRPSMAETAGRDQSIFQYFAGRAAELDRLRSAFSSGSPMVNVVGEFGTGKTALAMVFSELSKDLFPGGTLRYDPGSPPGILSKFLDSEARIVGPFKLLIVDETSLLSDREVASLRGIVEVAPSVRVLAVGREPILRGVTDSIAIRLGALSQADIHDLIGKRFRGLSQDDCERVYHELIANSHSGTASLEGTSEGAPTIRQILKRLYDFVHSGIRDESGEATQEVPQELAVTVCEINEELLARLRLNPADVYSLSPRKFEELVAELLHRQKWEVELTPESNDGGFDIYAVRTAELGKVLFLVECKKWTPPNHVGVKVVRSLYGVVEEKRATAGTVVTTSFFTKRAKEFEERLEFRLHLQDFNALSNWLKGT
jgi:restriction system protein